MDRAGPMSFDLVIFDCDGVLVDSEILSCRTLSETLRANGFEISPEEVFERFLGRSTLSTIEECRDAGHVLPDDFTDQLGGNIRRAFAKDLKPIEHVAALLDRIEVPVCVASSGEMERIRFSLGLTGLAERFGEHVFSAQMVERGKPEPDLFLFAARQMGVPPARALVIEDSVAGVRAAKAAGMTAWGFTGGSHYAARAGEARLLEAGADRIFTHMREMEAALIAVQGNG